MRPLLIRVYRQPSSSCFVPFSDDVIVLCPAKLLDRTQPLELEDQDKRVAMQSLGDESCVEHSGFLCLVPSSPCAFFTFLGS